MLIVSSAVYQINENKLDVYRVKDCMKKFCEFLREHAAKIINFKSKKKKERNY